jgi:AbrB family looped-hinge helix DNA binding protein
METVKVSGKGQILLPKMIREACSIRPGAELVIAIVGDEIHLKPTQPPIIATTVAAGRGLLADPKRKPLDDAEIRRRITARLQAQDAATKSAE